MITPGERLPIQTLRLKESTFKTMEDVSHFIVKVLFVLEIFSVRVVEASIS